MAFVFVISLIKFLAVVVLAKEPKISHCTFGLANAVFCQGKHCSELAVGCRHGIELNETHWNGWFSEGPEHNVCPENHFVSGLKCQGRFCDDISLECSTSEFMPNNNCYWSQLFPKRATGHITLGDGQFFRGMKCFGRFCDKKAVYVCDIQSETGICDSADCEQRLAERFAPLLKFDQGQGEPNKCFPSDATYYYEQRKSGVTKRICQLNYHQLQDAMVPTYYQFDSCGSDRAVIRYWFFYGYQDDCFLGVGDHDADWEHLAIKIEEGQLAKVMFVEHAGHYTKVKGNFTHWDDHPHVFVGKNSHGNYHEIGGPGSCVYFKDFHNPGAKNFHLETWRNLVKFRTDESAPEWMRLECDNSKMFFDGIAPPNCYGGNMCNLAGCTGKSGSLGGPGSPFNGICFGQCGCQKSDIGNEPF